MSGFAAINGFADREPVLPPMYLADGIAGLYGASAAMIALREVEVNGGKGQVIDLPLLDPLFAMLGPQAAELSPDRARCKPRTGSRSTNSAPRNAYRCKDGKYVGAVGLDAEDGRARCSASIGRPELDRRPALPHQRRPREARRRARRDHRRVHRASARRPRTSPSSRRPR